MIEIRSEYQGVTESERGYFVIHMARDGKWINTAIVPELLHDPESAVESIKSMIAVLLNNSFPELKDPIYGMKKELEILNNKKNSLSEKIKMMELARKNLNEQS